MEIDERMQLYYNEQKRKERDFNDIESNVESASKKRRTTKEEKEENQTFKIVVDLVHQVPFHKEREYIVVADQFYGQQQTTKRLKEEGHHSLCSIQANRLQALIKNYL